MYITLNKFENNKSLLTKVTILKKIFGELNTQIIKNFSSILCSEMVKIIEIFITFVLYL